MHTWLQLQLADAQIRRLHISSAVTPHNETLRSNANSVRPSSPTESVGAQVVWLNIHHCLSPYKQMFLEDMHSFSKRFTFIFASCILGENNAEYPMQPLRSAASRSRANGR